MPKIPECENCNGFGIIFGPTDERTGQRLTKECPKCEGYGINRQKARQQPPPAVEEPRPLQR